MGQRNQGIFSIEKSIAILAINRELTMTLMRLIAIKYFKRLTALIITSLTDKALAWAPAIWQLQGPEYSDITLFTNEILRISDQSASGQEVAKKLLLLRQGRDRVSDYAISFRTLAAESGWNETAPATTFLNGLSESLKDCLAATECPKDLESIIFQAIRLDNRLRERRRDQTSGQQPSFQRRPTPITPLWNQPAPTEAYADWTSTPLRRRKIGDEGRDCASIVADQDISEPFVPTW